MLIECVECIWLTPVLYNTVDDVRLIDFTLADIIQSVQSTTIHLIELSALHRVHF